MEAHCASNRNGPAVVGDDALLISSTGNPRRLTITGEIDESSYPMLLVSLTTAGDREIHIDLGGVTYCDLAGLRAMIRLAEPGSGNRPARRVVLHAVPPQFREILHILGWDAIPGIDLRN
jgi:anti-anti-sigma regulatory factor